MASFVVKSNMTKKNSEVQLKRHNLFNIYFLKLFKAQLVDFGSLVERIVE